MRCRVKTGNLETEWLRWPTPRASATRTWDPPTVGEQVVVVSPSGVLENGLVFYGFNCDAHPAPSSSPDKHVVRFPDGGTLSYDHAASHLDITGIASCCIVADESIALVAGESIMLDPPLTHCTGIAEDLASYIRGLYRSPGSKGEESECHSTNAETSIGASGKSAAKESEKRLARPIAKPRRNTTTAAVPTFGAKPA